MIGGSSVIAALPEPTLPILTGCGTFALTLAVSTTAQKLVGISTGTRLLPSLVGFATVYFASIFAQQACVANHGWLQQNGGNLQLSAKNLSLPKIEDIKALPSRLSLDKLTFPTPSFKRDEHWKVGEFKIPKHDVRIGIIGALAFKAIGGRFWGVAPSSLTHPGSFKRWSIPCTDKYATPAQRSMIERMGTLWGCHTCGSRMLLHRGTFKFAGDHMPPKSVASEMNKTWIRRAILGDVKFRFYPQCANCSNVQGTTLLEASRSMGKRTPATLKASHLKRAGGGRASHNHALRPRLNHLTGGVLAGMTVVGATDAEIREGNQQRFARLSKSVEDGCGKVWKRLKSGKLL